MEQITPAEPADDFTKLMAAVAYFHPQLHDEARSKVSTAEFDEYLARIRENGLAPVFVFAGNIVNGWW